MAEQAAIHVNYRLVNGYHVYTSDDVYGLYVANTDAQAAYDAVAPSLERLIKLNENIDCHVEPAMTFTELLHATRHPDEPVHHEPTSRSFVARAA